MLTLAAAVALYLAAGVMAGLVSGLFGMGGGLAVVPMLVLALTLVGIGGVHIMHLAVGTSLAVIIITSIYTTLLRRRSGDLDRDLLKAMVLPVAAGAVAGAVIADLLNELALRLLFIAFVGYMILRMARRRFGAPNRPGAENGGELEPLKRQEYWLFGMIAGTFGALLGIGVAAVMTPIMTARGYRIQTVSAMAAALAIIVGSAGGAGFMITGLNETGLPAASAGYVYLPALAGLAIGALVGSPMGIMLSHRLSQNAQLSLFLAYLVAVLIFMVTR